MFRRVINYGRNSMATINTNMSANIASNALTRNERSMSSTMERLSTGLRINSAKDDAAGLAISSKMTSQIRGLNQAVRNANDAVSMLQVAEGAMSGITDMLQRMRELAIQAISDSNTSADRVALDAEYQQLRAEINRIGGNTQWNGTNLLDGQIGSSGTMTFQVGANASQTVAATFTTMGSTEGTVSSATTTDHGSSAAQVSTITLASGSFREGDVVSYTIDGKTASFGISIASGAMDAIDNAVNIASTSAGTVTAARTSATTVTLTAGTQNKAFVLDNLQVSRGVAADVAKSDITTAASATTSLTTIANAITSVDSARASNGASMNRLEYASDNLQNVAQNTAAARSRILDADYAAETTELARSQIIQQAATAMLAQANAQATSVISLLT
ncbi:MAG: flagellin [Gammaproteobacteria bacterium]|nr:flagellin [Gammaproteobacteria bacterium]